MSNNAKEAGNAAYNEGRYQEAIECFTRAINEDQNNASGSLHSLYSNRSAAYCQLKQYNQAIEDADKCIALKPNWGKGYSRKGKALFDAGRFSDAYNAYQRGLREEPGNDMLKQGLDDALRRLQQTSEPQASSGRGWYGNTSGSGSGSSSSSSGSNNNARPSAAPVGTVKQILTRDRLETSMFIIHAFVLIQFVMSLIPLGSISYGAGRRLVLASMVRFMIYLFQAHGKPQFNMQYAQAILMDAAAPYLLLSIFLYAGRTNLLPTLPLVLVQLFHFGVFFYPLALAVNTTYAATLASHTDQLLSKVMNDARWTSKPLRQKQEEVWRKVVEVSALCEVAYGVYLIVELLLPSRNLIGLFLFWQFLQMRYMLEQTRNDTMAVRNAFKLVDSKILAAVNHPYCPALVRTGYNYIRNFLISKSQLPQPGQQPSSMCTIM